jgi:streptogramin lyase
VLAAGSGAGVSPGETAVGANPNLWFTEFAGNKIGRLDLLPTAAGTTVEATEGHKHLPLP